jgi:hypothetical protein
MRRGGSKEGSCPSHEFINGRGQGVNNGQDSCLITVALNGAANISRRGA